MGPPERAGDQLEMTRTRPLGFFGWLKHQRGTSTLEFAVVLPTLLIIFLGGLELARAWLTVNIATNAVREGARVGAASNPTLSGTNPINYGFDNTQALLRLNQVLSAANLTPYLGSVSVTCIPTATPPAGTTGCTPDSEIQASATVNFITVAPLFLPVLGTPANPLVIQETARMRRE
jgi:Flp pilus assembly protein TadG